ncbi:MAG: hypothetical protein IKO10_07075 [Lachnospiraceae bacterium]|nr:hypothetical protein [Lachnospiraceae bacterium]
MIEYFNEVMRNCASIVREHIRNQEPDEELQTVLGINYRNAQEEDFHYDDELFNAVYLLRYGYAYAFEYAFLYKMVIDDYDPLQNIFGVTSLGCGSCIDAWALAYAKNQVNPELSLRYVGMDMVRWGIQFSPNNDNAMERAYTFGNGYLGMRYPGRDDFPQGVSDILDFIENTKWICSYNTIIFPKILNELPDIYLNRLVEMIRNNADAIQADRDHHIIISHSHSQYREKQTMKTIAQRIVEAINYDNRFLVENDLSDEYIGEDGPLKNIADEEYWPCYAFKKIQQGSFFNCPRIEELNNDFEVEREISEVRDSLSSILHACKQRKCVTRATTSLFQIIKLIHR